MTAPDAAGGLLSDERVRELADQAAGGTVYAQLSGLADRMVVERAIRTAIRETAEAAAKVCIEEAVKQDNYQNSFGLSGEGDGVPDGELARDCADAIRARV